MHSCLQTEGQSIYQHGLSVKEHYFELLFMLRNNSALPGWRLPEWFFTFRNQILNHLMTDEIIEEYTLYHDCSKPFCKIIDEFGKIHFPNHAKLAGELWGKVGGNKEAAILMSMDMDIHNLKATEINDFVKRPQAITLLCVGLAEITANSKMFGGINSTSFKIKYKNINQRGKAICNKLFA